MDSIEFNGTLYISSKRAAEETGYAKDYIGQLVRSGKIDGKKVGRSWYVRPDEIYKHAGIETKKISETPTVSPGIAFTESLANKSRLPTYQPKTIQSIEIQKLPKTWSNIKYVADSSELYPNSGKRDEVKVDEITIKINKIQSLGNFQRGSVDGIARHFDKPSEAHLAIAASRRTANATAQVELKAIKARATSRKGDTAGLIQNLFLLMLLAFLITVFFNFQRLFYLSPL